MRISEKGYKKLFRIFSLKSWPIILLFILSAVFFYPVILKNEIPLPTDALVGAHVPWIEVSWKDYPAGVPIKNQEITDAISQFYPWRSLIGKYWRLGKAPLWNQFMFSGYPFLANLHSGALYPLNFLYLIFSDAFAWTGLVYLQIFLAMLFTFLFLKELGLNKISSVFGAIAFALSGYMIAWLEFATGGQAGLWLPLLLFFELKLIKNKNIFWIVPCTFTFFLIYTAGDFQVPFYETVIYIFFGLFLAITLPRTVKEKTKIFLKSILALFLGILISLPQLLPTIELFLDSVRITDPYIKEYYFGIMNWEKVVNFLWPDFFGNIVTRNYWGKYGYHEYLAFTGIVSIVFVIYAFITNKDKFEKFFWIILILSLLFLFPTPFAFLPYKLKIPALGTSSASRIIYLVDFCLAILASYGFHKWNQKKDGKIAKIIFYLLVISLAVALGIIINILILRQNSHPDILRIITNFKVSIKNMIPSTFFLILMLVAIVFYDFLPALKGGISLRRKTYLLSFVILLIFIVEILRFAWKNTPFFSKEYLFPTTPTIDYLMGKEKPFRISGSGIPLNYFMQYGLSSAEGYDPIYPWRNSRWYSLVNFYDTKNPGGRYGEIAYYYSPLINYANVAYIVDYKKNPRNKIISDVGVFADGLLDKRYEGIFSEKRVNIFENKYVLPRVWLSRNYEIAKNEEDLANLLLQQKNLEKVIIFENKPDIILSEKDSGGTVTDFSQNLNEISFNTDSPDDNYLFLSESYFPGWRAYIDGESTKIYKANYIFQVIYVAKGRHSVRFVYYPSSFKIGKSIALITLSGLVIFSIYRLRKIH